MKDINQSAIVTKCATATINRTQYYSWPCGRRSVTVCAFKCNADAVSAQLYCRCFLFQRQGPKRWLLLDRIYVYLVTLSCGIVIIIVCTCVTDRHAAASWRHGLHANRAHCLTPANQSRRCRLGCRSCAPSATVSRSLSVGQTPHQGLVRRYKKPKCEVTVKSPA